MMIKMNVMQSTRRTCASLVDGYEKIKMFFLLNQPCTVKCMCTRSTRRNTGGPIRSAARTRRQDVRKIIIYILNRVHSQWPWNVPHNGALFILLYYHCRRRSLSRRIRQTGKNCYKLLRIFSTDWDGQKLLLQYPNG